MNRDLRRVIDTLEAERYSPPVRPPQYKRPPRDTLPPITAEQAAHNREVLLDALSDDPVVVAFREREAS